MWAELVTGGAVMGLIGVIARFQNSRIDKCVPIDLWKQQTEQVEKRLKDGTRKFESMEKARREHGEALARIEVGMEFLIKSQESLCSKPAEGGLNEKT